MEIHAAVERGKTALVSDMLARDPSAIHARNKLDDQPLHTAAHNGRANLVEMLLNCGADINAKGDHGRTPLHFAVMGKKKKIIEILLRSKANPNLKDAYGCTPLYLAASVQEKTTCRSLLAAGALVDLRAELYLESPDTVLAKLQANTEVCDAILAQQLLFNAINLSAVELVSYLLSHGANPGIPGFGNTPPLLQAIPMRNTDVVRLLLKAGADVSIREEQTGRSLLQFCAVYGAPAAMIELLRERGAA
jgi:ankyrin repeat protein